MPTNKYRLNVSLPRDVREVLTAIAKRDGVPIATKAVRLLELALEIEEDEVLAEIASKRAASNGPYISHEDAWK